MSKRSVDVLVAGGGPAGLAVAAEAARARLDVLLVEREREIGVPVHTSGGTAPSTVQRHGIPAEFFHPVTSLRFVGPSRDVPFHYKSPVMVVLDVRGTYQFLAQRAQSLGAEIRTGVTARAVMKGEAGAAAGLVLDAGEDPYEVAAKVVVDATGYRAAISKAAGLHAGFERFGVGAEVELIAPFCRQDEAVLIVGSRYAPAGYGWVFPWGDGRVRIGVGIHHGDVRSNPRDHLELLLQEAEKLGVDLRDSRRVEEHLGLIPAHQLPERFTGPGVMAVGDAACQATLVVGEGIRVSLEAGADAGRISADAIRAGTYANGGLETYERNFRRSHERSLRLGHYVNRRLATFDDAEWDEKLDLLRAVPAPALPRILQSDFSLQTMVTLLTGNPRLWLTVGRYAGRAAGDRLGSLLRN